MTFFRFDVSTFNQRILQLPLAYTILGTHFLMGSGACWEEERARDGIVAFKRGFGGEFGGLCGMLEYVASLLLLRPRI